MPISRAGRSLDALERRLAETEVRISNEQGRILAEALKNIFDDLGLTDEQRARTPELVRRHLLALTTQEA